MTYRYSESQIVHEAVGNKFWVLRTGSGYCVMENAITHSKGDGIEYPLSDDGLSIAIKYCDYRASRQVTSC